MKLIQQGAEAKIYLNNSENVGNKISLGGRRGSEALGGGASVIKQRIPKSYRIQELDNKIRKQRTKAEARILEKVSKIINVPKVKKTSDFEIRLEFINGKKLSQHLDNFSLKEQKEIMKKIGESVAKLHETGIIHGDLTTSNMIYVKKNVDKKNKLGYKGRWSGDGLGGLNNSSKVFLIDFGLRFQNGKIEDKGIDIHLLKQALEAKHFKNWKILFEEFEKSYKKTNKKESKQIFERLTAIEKRGRYRD